MALLNRAEVKRYALDISSKRAHKMTRVSAELFVAAEAQLREWLRQQVERQPSMGKTIYPLIRVTGEES